MKIPTKLVEKWLNCVIARFQERGFDENEICKTLSCQTFFAEFGDPTKYLQSAEVRKCSK